jgi:hypothetical protein
MSGSLQIREAKASNFHLLIQSILPLGGMAACNSI